MNAEIFRDQDNTWAAHLWLQWGRVLMNAEIKEAKEKQCECIELQWGRVLMNAEMMEKKNPPKTDSMLQWGRVLMNAEMM